MAVYLSRNTRVGPYKIKSLLAAGGEGAVYLATDHSGGIVALKQLATDVRSPDAAPDVERTRRLGRLVGKKSPHVCETLHIFEHNNLLYVAMEYVEGESLEAAIVDAGRLDLSALLPIARDVLAGLGWLHEQGIVHRDVKPANIVVCKGPDSEAKLVDLGIAFHGALPRLTVKGMVGTFEYAPPEVMRGGAGVVDPRADLYSFSATMFHALTGELPFPGTTPDEVVHAAFTAPRPSIRNHVASLPESLDFCLQQFMSIKPCDRPASAAEAWDLFEQAAAGIFRPTRPKAATAPRRATPAVARPATAPAPVPAPVAIASPMPPPSPELVVESGPYKGTRFALPRRGVCLGRTALNPADMAISRVHLRVCPHWRGLLVLDVNSKNGFLCKGKRMRRTVLARGESLTVGATSIACA